MINLNVYDMDIALENQEAIRSEVARHLNTRGIGAGRPRGPGLSGSFDSMLVRLGERASVRLASRGSDPSLNAKGRVARGS